MRCERMKATIPTALCLRRQDQVEKYVKTRKRYSNNQSFDAPNIPSHACYKCEQGAEIRKKSEGQDMDVEELRKAYPVEITTEVNPKNLQSKEKINRSRKRMKEANSPEVVRDSGNKNIICDKAPAPQDYTLSVYAGGLRIQLCRECARRWIVDIITKEVNPKNLQSKEKINRSRKRMKEANSPEVVRDSGNKNIICDKAPAPQDYTLSVYAGGLRIQLCRECARRYLRLDSLQKE